MNFPTLQRPHDDARPLMRASRARRHWRLSAHGAAVEIDCAVPSLYGAVSRWVDFFVEDALPAGFTPATGTVEPYDAAEVVRHLPSDARRLRRRDDSGAEYYELGERFWVVDERWGMAEMNVLKGQWRSWVLPRPKLDPVRCAEAAVIAPMAQVLRARAVHLVPAASVVIDDWAALIVCPYGLGPELSALIKAGYRVVGQRWTALREEDGRVAMLHVPGFVDRPQPGRRLRSTLGQQEPWVDLHAAANPRRRSFQNHAFADAVLIVEAGRRPRAHLRLVEDDDAAGQLVRQAWPIPALHPQRRLGALPTKLATECACADVRLSRDPRDLIALLRSLRQSSSAAQTVKLELTLTPWARLQSRRTKLLAA
jgi:hypothetical protein